MAQMGFSIAVLFWSDQNDWCLRMDIVGEGQVVVKPEQPIFIQQLLLPGLRKYSVY